MIGRLHELWNRALGAWEQEDDRSGVARSYPLPVRVRAAPCFLVFSYPAALDPKRGAHILAPTALHVFDWTTGDAATAGLASTVAAFRELPAVGWARARFRPSEYKPRVVELCELAEELGAAFFARVVPAAPLAHRFLERLGELEPGMAAYYRTASPAFAAWLETPAAQGAP